MYSTPDILCGPCINDNYRNLVYQVQSFAGQMAAFVCMCSKSAADQARPTMMKHLLSAILWLSRLVACLHRVEGTVKGQPHSHYYPPTIFIPVSSVNALAPLLGFH